MTKIRCLLVDDEPPAIDLLAKYAGMIDQLVVVGKSHNAVKAFDLLKKGNVDLIFLDIRMPVLNGIDFLKTLKNPPAIIITTAYREYAVEGYDLDIVDYLLKPIAFDRFLKAVDRFRERNLQMPIIEVPELEAKPHIFLNVNRTHHKIYLDDIYYIESLKDYVRVHTETVNLVVKGNIGSFMKRIPEEKFVRIHRSYAVAIDYIQSFSQSEIVIKNQKLPIGVSYKKVVTLWMK
ncbi:LytR/AlgR family response regulator transcription factor [Portibacter lacus]|uniref:DNA-binding response regulator n=1 Tax=Portibacter lacus TaxID=1099794 RepID=A0AA37SPM2_9BACT|nr:response regulator transcription factor [Portibacter lacus]GLR17524.1 DNA-binding response regulator [Portibacter lacus]